MCKDIETFRTINKSIVLGQIVELGHEINDMLESVEMKLVTLDALTQFQHTKQFYDNHQQFGQIVDRLNSIFQPYVDEHVEENRRETHEMLSDIGGDLGELLGAIAAKLPLND